MTGSASVYIGRTEAGAIYGVWTVPQWPDQESLPEDDAEVVAFRERPMPAPAAVPAVEPQAPPELPPFPGGAP